MRQWLAFLVLAIGMVASPAAAQSPANISLVTTPTTFHDAGETISTTLTFNTGSRIFSNLISFDLNGVLVPASCSPSTNPDTNATIACTANYTIQPTDLYIDKLLRARVKFSAAGTPVQLSYITTTVTYIPTLVTPTITAISPTSGIASGGTTVSITGTDFNSITAVMFGGAAATAYTVNTPNRITATSPAGTGTANIRVTNGAGTSAATSADQFTYISPPTVTSISPTSGPTAGGTTVVVTGTNFTGTTAVSFGGASMAYTVNSDTQITVTSPAGTGTVDVRVTNAAGTSASNAADQFTYIPAPTVTAITPTSGPTAGGTSVVITGSNFLAANAVSFGGTPATGYTINSNSQIVATAPAGSGTVDVRVSSTGGISATSAADQFSYIGAPTVTGVSPVAGPSAGGNSVVITGANLSGATAVTFGATPATAYTVNSATQITATAPAGTGTVDVRVTSAGGTSTTSAADQYSYVATPTVTGISPSSGPNAGGNSVVITGANLTGATSVTFGAAPAVITVNSATQITATAPSGTGTIDVVVTTAGGISAISAADRYSFVAQPAITALTPSAGPTSGGTAVTISGNNFLGATAVTFGGVSASFTVDGATQITAMSPAGSGTVDVVIATAGGASPTSAADQFTYVDEPVASSFTAATVAFNAGSAGSTLIDLSTHATNSPTSYTVGSTTTTAGGLVSVDTAGQATYQPPVGFSGNDSFTFTATNTGGTSGPATVTVPVGTPTLSITPAGSTLPSGTVDAGYSQSLSASGGIAPYTFTLTAGALPTGLSLTSSGVIQGTPTTAGAFTFQVTATDSSPNPGPYSANRIYSLSIGQGGQTITFANPGPQTYGASPTLTASSTSGLAVSFSSSTTGVCTITSGGTLTFVGLGTCTINADQPGDANFSAASTVTQSFTVNTPPLGTTSSDVTGTVAQPLGPVTPVTASGGQPAYTYALTGTLPAGLTFSTSDGAISGTPTASLATTLYTVTVTDSLGQSTSGTFQLTIGAPTITVVPTTLPNATSGVAYSQTITASGGTAPYMYSVTAGALPAGLTVSAGGSLSGTPTAPGTFNFTLAATDSSTGAGPFTGSRAYTLRVDLPPAPVIAPVPTQTTPGNTSSSSQSLTIDLASYISGQYTSVATATPVSHGTLTLTGTTATYTPAVGFSGTDSFSFTATGPGGTSAPATVTIDVEGVEPSAANLTATATQSVPVSVELTAGAAGGPFTGATVVSVSPAGSLTTSVAEDGNGRYILTATPSPTFEGVAVVSYTLSNDFGASAPATVTITVAARPDPTTDATVNGISTAQAEAARRFAVTQLGNFQRRNEQLHHGGGAGVSTLISLGGGDGEKLRRAKLAFNVPGWIAPETSDVARTASDSAQDTGLVSLAPPAPIYVARPVGSLALWSGGALTIGSRDEVGGRDKLDFNSQGLSAGADVRFTEALTVGIGGGVGWDRTDVGQDDAGRVRSKAWSVAAYGSLMAAKNVFVDGVVGVGDLDNRTRREAVNGETALGNRDGRITFASLGAGYDGRTGSTDLSVYGKLDWMRATLDAYVEQGAGIFDLAFASRQVNSLAGVVGTRAAWQLDGWRPHVRAEWRHEFKGLGDQRVDYADVGAYRFALGGQGWSTNNFSADVGADVSMGAGWSSGFEVGGGLGGDSRFGTARASIAKQF